MSNVGLGPADGPDLIAVSLVLFLGESASFILMSPSKSTASASTRFLFPLVSAAGGSGGLATGSAVFGAALGFVTGGAAFGALMGAAAFFAAENVGAAFAAALGAAPVFSKTSLFSFLNSRFDFVSRLLICDGSCNVFDRMAPSNAVRMAVIVAVFGLHGRS